MVGIQAAWSTLPRTRPLGPYDPKAVEPVTLFDTQKGIERGLINDYYSKQSIYTLRSLMVIRKLKPQNLSYDNLVEVLVAYHFISVIYDGFTNPELESFCNKFKKPQKKSAQKHERLIITLENADRNVTFRFLDLPAELRGMVYDLCLTSSTPVRFTDEPDLLQTSKFLRNEAVQRFHHNNDFILDVIFITRKCNGWEDLKHTRMNAAAFESPREEPSTTGACSTRATRVGGFGLTYQILVKLQPLSKIITSIEAISYASESGEDPLSGRQIHPRVHYGILEENTRKSKKDNAKPFLNKTLNKLRSSGIQSMLTGEKEGPPTTEGFFHLARDTGVKIYQRLIHDDDEEDEEMDGDYGQDSDNDDFESGDDSSESDNDYLKSDNDNVNDEMSDDGSSARLSASIEEVDLTAD